MQGSGSNHHLTQQVAGNYYSTNQDGETNSGVQQPEAQRSFIESSFAGVEDFSILLPPELAGKNHDDNNNTMGMENTPSLPLYVEDREEGRGAVNPLPSPPPPLPSVNNNNNGGGGGGGGNNDNDDIIIQLEQMELEVENDNDDVTKQLVWLHILCIFFGLISIAGLVFVELIPAFIVSCYYFRPRFLRRPAVYSVKLQSLCVANFIITFFSLLSNTVIIIILCSFTFFIMSIMFVFFISYSIIFRFITREMTLSRSPHYPHHHHHHNNNNNNGYPNPNPMYAVPHNSPFSPYSYPVHPNAAHHHHHHHSHPSHHNNIHHHSSHIHHGGSSHHVHHSSSIHHHSSHHAGL